MNSGDENKFFLVPNTWHYLSDLKVSFAFHNHCTGKYLPSFPDEEPKPRREVRNPVSYKAASELRA